MRILIATFPLLRSRPFGLRFRCGVKRPALSRIDIIYAQRGEIKRQLTGIAVRLRHPRAHRVGAETFEPQGGAL
jgi:hypothetical protein